MVVSLATEDALGEAVGLRLLTELVSPLELGVRLRKEGAGYLRSRVSNFHELARRNPILVITDLDTADCPASLIEDWTKPCVAKTPGFLLRVAVREIESWLLADHDAMRDLLGQKVSKLPPDPDRLSNPKKHLLDLARRAPRELRNELVAAPGAIASQGPLYNSRMCNFVESMWNPRRASIRSDSLRRTIKRIRELSG